MKVKVFGLQLLNCFIAVFDPEGPLWLQVVDSENPGGSQGHNQGVDDEDAITKARSLDRNIPGPSGDGTNSGSLGNGSWFSQIRHRVMSKNQQDNTTIPARI